MVGLDLWLKLRSFFSFYPIPVLREVFVIKRSSWAVIFLSYIYVRFRCLALVHACSIKLLLQAPGLRLTATLIGKLLRMRSEEFEHMGSLDPSFVQEEQPFATVNNLEHCVKYINQTLVAYGFPAPLELGSQNPVAVARTCNCLYAVLQQRQYDVAFRETANEQRQRLFSDLSRLESKVERLEGHLAAKEREMAAMLSKEQKLTTNFKAQLEKLQQERDEFQKMVIGTQQVRTQQLHELKKKEKEFIKLQERLNQVLADKKKETKSGMEIMSLLQKEGRQRGTWNSKKADGDFYKMIVDAYETKKQELMTENAELRALLRSMQTDMREFLNKGMVASETSYSDAEPPATPLGGRTDVFDLPFHMARDQIEESLRAKMASIKEYMAQFQEAEKGMHLVSEASDRELELEAQLVEARSIIKEQAALMKENMVKIDESESCADDSHDIEQVQRFATNWSALQQMSQQLDKEHFEMMKTKERLQEEQTNWNAKLSTWGPETGKVFKELKHNAELMSSKSHRLPGSPGLKKIICNHSK